MAASSLNAQSRSVKEIYTYRERLIIAYVGSGILSIDSLGQIWRHCKNRRRPNSCEPFRAESKCQDGYLRIDISTTTGTLRTPAHRLVWQYFHGDIPEGMTINHINAVRDDNRPGNLEVVTQAENIRHGARLGNVVGLIGARNHWTRITDEQVREIRRRRAAGETLKTIATDIGMSVTGVCAIVNGRSRRHVV